MDKFHFCLSFLLLPLFYAKARQRGRGKKKDKVEGGKKKHKGEKRAGERGRKRKKDQAACVFLLKTFFACRLLPLVCPL
jgi:hypothetical protein